MAADFLTTINQWNPAITAGIAFASAIGAIGSAVFAARSAGKAAKALKIETAKLLTHRPYDEGRGGFAWVLRFADPEVGRGCDVIFKVKSPRSVRIAPHPELISVPMGHQFAPVTHRLSKRAKATMHDGNQLSITALVAEDRYAPFDPRDPNEETPANVVIIVKLKRPDALRHFMKRRFQIPIRLHRQADRKTATRSKW